MKLYGVVEFKDVAGYSKLLMPLDDALVFCNLFSEAKIAKTDYAGAFKEITNYEDQLTLQILSEDKVKALMLENSLELQN